jgi:hypothetical protein
MFVQRRHCVQNAYVEEAWAFHAAIKQQRPSQRRDCPALRLSLRDLQSFGANLAKFVTLAGFDPTSREVQPWRCFLHARNN